MGRPLEKIMVETATIQHLLAKSLPLGGVARIAGRMEYGTEWLLCFIPDDLYLCQKTGQCFKQYRANQRPVGIIIVMHKAMSQACDF